MDLELPAELSCVPSALVAFAGLDPEASPRHRELWRRFAGGDPPSAPEEGAPPPPPPPVDRRVPLHFVAAHTLDWHQMKPKRNSYEWFIPKGILKKNWMKKHLEQLPAVVVVFVDLDWNDADFNQKKADCAERVKAARSTLSGRGTKIAVVLVQRETSLPVASDDVAASERAATLCAACELSNRSLFVLPLAAENLDGYVLRLENAFYELAQNYYHQEIRGVKSHRDYLNKTTHLYLFVRHQFKIGFLNELKRDYHAAYKHYGQAYNLLMEVRATDTNIMEVKTVAGFISYKICKLAFRVNLPRDAISQFRKHMDIFQQKVGMDVLAFEHKGWQSKQCEFFADVFTEAIENGLPAIQTQHPGLYYQQAAQYAIARRETAEEQCAAAATASEGGESGAESAYPSPDPLRGASGLEFFGQRPWRPGKVSLEPPDMELETAGVHALLHRERGRAGQSAPHVIGLLQRAIAQFRTFRSPRSESHLTVSMAEELKTAQRYREALDLLVPVMRHYRAERWRPLLDAVLSLGVRCAFLLGDAAAYAALCLDLCSPESSSAPREKARVAGNLCRILDGQVPSAEPGLTSKSERAAVGEAAKLWTALLQQHKKDAPPVLVDMGDKSSAVGISASFLSSLFKADRPAKLQVRVTNRFLGKGEGGGGGEEDCRLRVSRIRATLSNQNHILEWEAEEKEETLAPGLSTRKTFAFQPEAEDVGARLRVKALSVVLGRKKGFRIEVATSVGEEGDSLRSNFIIPRPTRRGQSRDVADAAGGESMEEVSLAEDGEEEEEERSSAEILQRDPLVTMSLDHRGPALVGEWFPVEVTLRNGEPDGEARGVEVSAALADAFDPLIADTTTLAFDEPPPEAATASSSSRGSGEERQHQSSLATLARKLEPIAKGGVARCRLLVRSSTVGRRGIRVRSTYSVTCTSSSSSSSSGGLECRSTLSDFLDLRTLEAFSLDSVLLSLRLKPVQQTHTDEPFMLLAKLRSLTGHAVTVLDSWLEARPPLRLLDEKTERPPASQLKGCRLGEASEAREMFTAVVRRRDLLSSLDVQEIGLGKYVVKWRRSAGEEEEDESRSGLTTTTTFDLPPCRVRLSGLHASASLPSHGVVRTPMSARLSLRNRTDRAMEFALSVDPSEAFMLSGNKQLQAVRVPPGGGEARMDFVLYPLVAGEAVELPRVRLAPARISQGAAAAAMAQDNPQAVMDRMLPRTIAVLPRARGEKKKESRKDAEKGGRDGGNFKLGELVRLKNKPFQVGGKVKVATN